METTLDDCRPLATLHGMKAEVLCPTVQYGNIRFFLEGEPDEIVSFSEEMNRLIAQEPGEGIPEKQFNKALDRYLTDGSGLTEEFVAMSRQQQDIFQAIKRSLKRIAYAGRQREDE